MDTMFFATILRESHNVWNNSGRITADSGRNWVNKLSVYKSELLSMPICELEIRLCRNKEYHVSLLSHN